MPYCAVCGHEEWTHQGNEGPVKSDCLDDHGRHAFAEAYEGVAFSYDDTAIG
jgi:hypothetical protein